MKKEEMQLKKLFENNLISKEEYIQHEFLFIKLVHNSKKGDVIARDLQQA